MKKTTRIALAGAIALALGYMANASASSQVLSITPSGAGLGSFSSITIDNSNRIIDLGKTFDRVAPILLTFTIGHGTGNGSPYTLTEAIINNTGLTWRDFHFRIVEPDANNGVTFNSHTQSTLTGFTLDNSSGPRDLNFTGTLLDGGVTDAAFKLGIPDPGADKTFIFQLVQTPTIPEPGTWAMVLAGLLGVAGLARRKI
jgi:hypothetical protein